MEQQQSTTEKPEKKLTTREKLFVEAYCTTDRGNAAAAARRAGFSEKAARQEGYRLLTNAYIAKAVSQRFDELGMSSGEAFSLLSEWGRDGLEPFLFPDESGRLVVNLTNPKAVGKLRGIKKIKQFTTTTTTDSGVIEKTTVEITVVDPLAAVSKILEVHGKIIARTDLTTDGKPLPPGVMLYLPDNARQTPDE